MLKYLIPIIFVLLIIFLCCNYYDMEKFSPGVGIQLLSSKPYYTGYDYLTWMNKYPYMGNRYRGYPYMGNPYNYSYNYSYNRYPYMGNPFMDYPYNRYQRAPVFRQPYFYPRM